jgi:copper resistance protein B
MKRLLILLAGASFSTPAYAQHEDHSAHGASPPTQTEPAQQDPHAGHQMSEQPTEADPHAGHRMPAEPEQSDPHAGHQMPAEPAEADPHAGHQMPAEPAEADPHAGHQMPEEPAQVDPHAGHAMPEAPAQADPHAGHAMPAQPAQDDPHAGHQMPAQEEGPPVAPPPPGAFTGPEHAADLVYPTEDMARSRREMHDSHGNIPTFKFLVDQLEAKLRDGRDGYAWDAQAWYGADIDKLWLKTEGEGEFGRGLESAEVQALWSRAIDPWFDLQLGLRQDFGPGPDRTHLVLGVQGLAPYWFEVDAAAFVSAKGDVTARLEVEYDLRLTQKLILQPLFEVDAAMQDIRELGIGAGLSSAELGVRLRYEIAPEFAPYIGVEYERAFGDTARFARDAGEDRDAFSFLIGLRTWF